MMYFRGEKYITKSTIVIFVIYFKADICITKMTFMKKNLFIGRHAELEKLRLLTGSKIANLVVIKGRRRVGKSRLAEEFGVQSKGYEYLYFTGLPPGPQVSADAEREDFAQQLARELKIPLPRADDWNTLLWTLSDRIRQRKTIVVLDEINWMGSKDPTFLGKLKSAWDRDFSKVSGLVLILCGSLTSWIERNILHSTGFLGRITLDMTLQELPMADCGAFWGTRGNRISNYEKLRLLAVTGGIPRYLESMDPAVSTDENIRRLCFEPDGMLFREFDVLFDDLFQRRNKIYRQIVEALAEKPLSFDALTEALEREKSGALSDYLDELESCGFIQRDYTWALNSGKASKLSHIRLKDNYCRFYLKAIAPNKHKILRNSVRTLPNIDGLLGLQFENLVLSNRSFIWEKLDLKVDELLNDNPFFQRATQRMKGCQVDYLIQTQKRTLYVCEIKYHRQPLDSGILSEVEERVRRLSLPRNISVRPVLVHVNGVTDAVLDAEYFDAIIDFGEALKPSSA